MPDDDKLLKNRFTELAQRALSGGQVFSEFLTLAQQDVVLTLRLPCEFTLSGGYETAERKIACFGETSEQSAAVWVKIAPRGAKFSRELTHRDFLGALMGMGLRRETLGDIVTGDGGTAYLFCLKTVAGFIVEQLCQAGSVPVSCTLCGSAPAVAEKATEPLSLTVASLRTDVLVCAAFSLSRNTSLELFAQKRVFINGRLAEKPSSEIENGDIVSVRSMGRFVFEGVEGQTKKGKLRVSVRVYR